MFRATLRSRLAQMGSHPDYQLIAAEVLGLRVPNQTIARHIVEQALVVEDRQEVWNRLGQRVQPVLPTTPGVYVMRDAAGRMIYVGKARNLKRRVSTYFAERRWRGLTPELPSATSVELHEVGSELEALLLEADLIERWLPPANKQTRAPRRSLKRRATRVRDVILLLPSIDPVSVELICARTDGAVLQIRALRSATDLSRYCRRIVRFFHGLGDARITYRARAAMVFAWLAGRGDDVTRLDPRDLASPRELGNRLRALLTDPDLFTQRIDQRGGRIPNRRGARS